MDKAFSNIRAELARNKMTIEDLAKYLRGFGSSVLVVQPPQLIDRMRDSVERSLNAYREEGYFA